MATAETARLIASLELDPRKFTRGLSQAEQSLGGFSSRIGKAGSALKNSLAVGATAGAALAAGIVGSSIKSGIESLADLESATTSVDAAIKQVGPTWHTTAARVAAAANEIEANVGAAFDDKDITRATATLIRFGKVSEDNLRPAMQVMTDLAARTGDVDSAAVLLGKALADPEKAAGKLSRAGVVLTKAQIKQIKAMVKAGDVAGAQALLLKTLEQTTKGAAAATQGPYQRSLSVLKDVTEDAQRALAEGFLPIIERVRDVLSKILADPRNIDRIRDFGKGLASGLDTLIDFAGKIPWGTIGDSLRIAGTGARAVFDAFTKLPAWVQTAVLTGWGLNKLSGGLLSGIAGDLAKGLIKGVLGINAGVVNVKAATVTGVGGGGVPTPVGGKGGLSTLARLTLVGETIGLVLAVNQVREAVTAQAAAQARDVHATQNAFLAIPRSTDEIKNALAGVDEGIRQINKDPIQAIIFGDALSELQGMHTELSAALASKNKDDMSGLKDLLNLPPAVDRTKSAVDTLRESAIPKIGETTTAINLEKDAITAAQKAAAGDTTSAINKDSIANVRGLGTVKNQVAIAGSVTASATRGVAPPIVSAIYANRPIITTNVNVNATSVTKQVTVVERYGTTGGSRDTSPLSTSTGH